MTRPPRRLPGPPLLLLVILAGAGCRAGPGPTPSDAGRKREPRAAAPAPATVYAWHFRASLRASRRGIGGFARLPGAARLALAAAAGRPDVEVEGYLLGPRLLLTFDRRQPLGPIEVLVADDIDAVVGFREERRRFVLPRSGLLAALEAGPLDLLAEARPATSVIPPPYPAGRPGARPVGRRVTVALRSRPASPGGREVSLRLRVDLLVDTASPVPARHAAALAHVIAPHLARRGGEGAMEVLAHLPGLPLAWRLSVRNEAHPAPRQAIVEGCLLDAGHVRVPAGLFSASRPAYRTERWDPARALGHAVAPPDLLGRIRPGETAGPLEVRNATRRAARVYVDGVYAAWVGAGQRLAIAGLAAGFYRVYGASPFGTRAFGPRDVYVPGPITLR